MDADEFEAGQRAGERFHALTVPVGMWTVLRVDGRAFSRFTEERFEKPFDQRFSDHMITTATVLLTELGGRYGYTESDEISILLPVQADLFGRSVEKLVSISAGIASAAFTHAAGEPVHFDARVWSGASVEDVVDYFSWRQSDAARCALNGWCYWTLRGQGRSAREATVLLDGASTADKKDLLSVAGIDFDGLPAWQRRGVGVWWQTVQRPGYDPMRRVEVSATRREPIVERELPMKDAYRQMVAGIAEGRVAVQPTNVSQTTNRGRQPGQDHLLSR